MVLKCKFKTKPSRYSRTARKLFRNTNPIGKVIVADNNENFKITGVLEDFPQNSTISYAMLLPIEKYAKKFRGNGAWKTIDEDLGNYYYYLILFLACMQFIFESDLRIRFICGRDTN